jgi:single-strand DNA-binding protein
MSNDINKLVQVTRLTKDAELKFTNSGFQITTMSGAVNRSVKKQDQWVEEVSFFDYKLLGKRGEALNQYLVKGTQLAIEGQMIQERWEKDGQKRSKVIIQIDNIQLLGGNKQNNQENNNSGGYGNNQKPNVNQSYQQGNNTMGNSNDPNDPNFIPF